MASQPNKPGGAQKGLSPKQLAEQARAESEAAERRRERTIRIVGGLLILLVVGGVLTIGFLAGRGNDQTATSTSSPAPTPDAGAPSPKGVDPSSYGLPYGTGWTSADSAKLPTLELWEDFQCPACAAVEKAAGPQIQALADDGLVKLLYRPATFLDTSLAPKNEENGTPNSSARATSAWGCAVDAGKPAEYHSGIFSIQPAEEGAGYTDQQLIDLGATAGIAGEDLTTFTTCVQKGTYLAWAANSNQKFTEAGVGGTPTGYLNGVELDSAALVDIEGLKKQIAAATAP